MTQTLPHKEERGQKSSISRAGKLGAFHAVAVLAARPNSKASVEPGGRQ